VLELIDIIIIIIIMGNLLGGYMRFMF